MAGTYERAVKSVGLLGLGSRNTLRLPKQSAGGLAGGKGGIPMWGCLAMVVPSGGVPTSQSSSVHAAKNYCRLGARGALVGVDPWSNIVVLATGETGGAGDKTPTVLMKFDPSFKLLWARKVNCKNPGWVDGRCQMSIDKYGNIGFGMFMDAAANPIDPWIPGQTTDSTKFMLYSAEGRQIASYAGVDVKSYGVNAPSPSASCFDSDGNFAMAIPGSSDGSIACLTTVGLGSGAMMRAANFFNYFVYSLTPLSGGRIGAMMGSTTDGTQMWFSVWKPNPNPGFTAQYLTDWSVAYSQGLQVAASGTSPCADGGVFWGLQVGGWGIWKYSASGTKEWWFGLAGYTNHIVPVGTPDGGCVVLAQDTTQATEIIRVSAKGAYLWSIRFQPVGISGSFGNDTNTIAYDAAQKAIVFTLQFRGSAFNYPAADCLNIFRLPDEVPNLTMLRANLYNYGIEVAAGSTPLNPGEPSLTNGVPSPAMYTGGINAVPWQKDSPIDHGYLRFDYLRGPYETWGYTGAVG